MSYGSYDETARSIAEHAPDGDAPPDGAARPASRALQTVAGSASGEARDAAGLLGERIREQPLVAILIAGAIGYVVGWIGKRV